MLRRTASHIEQRNETRMAIKANRSRREYMESKTSFLAGNTEQGSLKAFNGFL